MLHHHCRNFLGFAREIFTDAGKYVVHFGYAPNTAAEMAEKTIAIRSGKSDVHVTPLAQMRTEVAVIPSVTGNQLVGPRGVCCYRARLHTHHKGRHSRTDGKLCVGTAVGGGWKEGIQGSEECRVDATATSMTGVGVGGLPAGGKLGVCMRGRGPWAPRGVLF